MRLPKERIFLRLAENVATALDPSKISKNECALNAVPRFGNNKFFVFGSGSMG
jgi:hypothetical protein